jgi:glutaredoxin-related protein
VANFQTDIVQEVTQAVAENRVVVAGMRYNPAVSKARDALKDSGIDFVYLEYGSYTSEWHKRLALKRWTGWPTFPMVFFGRRLVCYRKDSCDFRAYMEPACNQTQHNIKAARTLMFPKIFNCLGILVEK